MKVSVVSNSTPIIELAFLGKLEMLNKLFDKVYVTQQVYDEVAGDNKNRSGAVELKKKIQEGLIILYNINDSGFIKLMSGRLHTGELSVMAAAKEIGINYVLMDDYSARRTAENLNLIPIGTVGILKLAKVKGYISVKTFIG